MRAFLYWLLLGNPGSTAKRVVRVARFAAAVAARINREIEANETMRQEVAVRTDDLRKLQAKIVKVLDVA